MTQVADDVLGKVARQQHDLFRRVREGTLDPEKVIQGIQEVIQSSALLFQRDMRKEGWELLEDTVESKLFSVNQLELVPFLKNKEEYISGEELVKRAKKENASLGQRQAEYLLNHQEEMPKEWRQYYLFFPGTIWRDRGGRRNVPYLPWCDGRWHLRFPWLDDDFFDDHDRLLRPRE